MWLNKNELACSAIVKKVKKNPLWNAVINNSNIIYKNKKIQNTFGLLNALRVTFCIQVTSYCLLHEFSVTLLHRVTSYCLLHELEATFCIRVTSCFIYVSYELLFKKFFVILSFTYLLHEKI